MPKQLRGARGRAICPWASACRISCAVIPDEFYLGGIEVLTLLIVIAIMTPVSRLFNSFWTRILGHPGAAASGQPECGRGDELSHHDSAAVRGILPKLDFSNGIPDDCVTMVVVPTLLLNEKQVRRLVDDLEVRYLGNAGRNLHFALLTDMPDSEEHAEGRRSAGRPLRSSLIRRAQRKVRRPSVAAASSCFIAIASTTRAKACGWAGSASAASCSISIG